MKKLITGIVARLGVTISYEMLEIAQLIADSD